MWHVRERREEHKWFLWGGHLRVKDLLENLDVDARIQLSLKKCCGSADWIDVAQARVKWRAVVYSVTNLRIPLIADNFLPRTGRISI